jgi:hypothetical protein
VPPLEEYLEQADKLAQAIVTAWAVNTKAGNSAFFTIQFKALFDKAYQYQHARRLAQNGREHNALSEQEEAEEKATRQAFAEAYKAYYEKHAAAS